MSQLMAIQGMDVSEKEELDPKERMSCGCLKSIGFLKAFLAIEVGRSFLWGSRIPRVDRWAFKSMAPQALTTRISLDSMRKRGVV